MSLPTRAENNWCEVTLAKNLPTGHERGKQKFLQEWLFSQMVSLRSLTKPLVQFPVTCRMEGKKNGYFSEGTHSQSPLFKVYFHWNYSDPVRTRLQQAPSASEKSSLHARKTGEAVNFVTYDTSTLDADRSSEVSIFVTQHEEDTLHRWTWTISIHLFSKTCT